MENERIKGDLGEEVGAEVERLDYEALVFDEAVKGLPIARVGVSSWGDRTMGRMMRALYRAAGTAATAA